MKTYSNAPQGLVSKSAIETAESMESLMIRVSLLIGSNWENESPEILKKMIFENAYWRGFVSLDDETIDKIYVFVKNNYNSNRWVESDCIKRQVELENIGKTAKDKRSESV